MTSHPADPVSLLATLAAAGGDDPGATISPGLLETLAALGGGGGSPPAHRTTIDGLPPVSIVERARSEAAADLVVVRTLGEGGMGRVDLARQTALGREVALKRVRADRRCAPSVEALLVEAQLTGALEHPNIVPVHFLARDPDGEPVLVMKRVEGVVWRDLLRDPAHPAWGRDPAGDRLARSLEIFVHVCNAVEFAHSRGFLHRDLKPENVMVGAFGEVYVLDWGLSLRLDERGGASAPAFAGTPAYLAPEMTDLDARLDARTDVYLLGATLHEVVSGRPRHAGASVAAVLEAATTSAPVAYDDARVPAELGAICNRATARDPGDRYPGVRELRAAVTEFLRHRGSVELAAAAQRELATVRRLLAEGVSDDEERRLLMHRAAAECRFGFRQALRAWDGNLAARSGLQTLLELLVEDALGRGNHGAAAALLPELPEARPALAARCEALRRSDEERRDALARIERDRDESVGRKWRILVLVVPSVAAAIVTMIIGGGHLRFTVAPRTFVWLNAALYALNVSSTALQWRRLSTTHLNRTTTQGGLLVGGLVFVQNLLLFRYGATVPMMVSATLMLVAAGGVALAYAMRTRQFLVSALLAVAGAWLTWAAPDWAVGILLGTMLSVMVPAVHPWGMTPAARRD